VGLIILVVALAAALVALAVVTLVVLIVAACCSRHPRRLAAVALRRCPWHRGARCSCHPRRRGPPSLSSLVALDIATLVRRHCPRWPVVPFPCGGLVMAQGKWGDLTLSPSFTDNDDGRCPCWPVVPCPCGGLVMTQCRWGDLPVLVVVVVAVPVDTRNTAVTGTV